MPKELLGEDEAQRRIAVAAPPVIQAYEDSKSFTDCNNDVLYDIDPSLRSPLWTSRPLHMTVLQQMIIGWRLKRIYASHGELGWMKPEEADDSLTEYHFMRALAIQLRALPRLGWERPAAPVARASAHAIVDAVACGCGAHAPVPHPHRQPCFVCIAFGKLAHNVQTNFACGSHHVHAGMCFRLSHWH